MGKEFQTCRQEKEAVRQVSVVFIVVTGKASRVRDKMRGLCAYVGNIIQRHRIQ